MAKKDKTVVSVVDTSLFSAAAATVPLETVVGQVGTTRTYVVKQDFINKDDKMPYRIGYSICLPVERGEQLKGLGYVGEYASATI